MVEPEWRTIPEFPEYEASSSGSVRRVARAKGATPGKVLRPFKRSDGRMQVALSQGGRVYVKKVHRLVASAFLGGCPDGLEVCHNDGDCTNNAADNLRYDTHASNLVDRVNHDGIMYGDAHTNTKMPDSAVLDLWAMKSLDADTCRVIASRYSMSTSRVRSIYKRRNRKVRDYGTC